MRAPKFVGLCAAEQSVHLKSGSVHDYWTFFFKFNSFVENVFNFYSEYCADFIQ